MNIIEPNFSGSSLIAAERDRQIRDEGYSPEGDDQYAKGELVQAGICYAQHAKSERAYRGAIAYRKASPSPEWPWPASSWKPKNPRRDLVRAAALFAAEIDRRTRHVLTTAVSND